jgi:energy-coupling factor transporter transmembrane protein EcfT
LIVMFILLLLLPHAIPTSRLLTSLDPFWLVWIVLLHFHPIAFIRDFTE